MPLVAFHNDPAIKAKYLARVRQHREADHLIKGTGWEYGKGCAIGCTLEAYDHSRYPIELGIPEIIARLEDRIFEGLPNEKAMAWPERVLEAIRPGADLNGIWPKFAVWLMVDERHGVIRFAGDREGVRAAILGVADLYKSGWPTAPRAAAAAHAAYAAYAAAAYAAAGARATYEAMADKLIKLLAAA
jgi:hypothetical protein